MSQAKLTRIHELDGVALTHHHIDSGGCQIHVVIPLGLMTHYGCSPEPAGAGRMPPLPRMHETPACRRTRETGSI